MGYEQPLCRSTILRGGAAFHMRDFRGPDASSPFHWVIPIGVLLGFPRKYALRALIHLTRSPARNESYIPLCMLYTPVKRGANQNPSLGHLFIYVQSGKWYQTLDDARQVIANRIKNDPKPPDIVVMEVEAKEIWQAEAMVKANRYTIHV